MYLNSEKFVLPKGTDGIITLTKGEVIDLYCTDGFSAWADKKKLNVTCDTGIKFTLEEKTYEFKEFMCKADQISVVQKRKETCFNKGAILDVGFEVDFEVEKKFLKLYEICFDEVQERTHYVKHELTPANNKTQNVDRPDWRSTGYFNEKNLDELYNKDTQRKTVDEIVKDPVLGEKYINITANLSLSRGHLAANADFVLGSHKSATFWYMNAAPQWETFNSGNWEKIESGIRKYVAQRNIEVEVYSGTHGVTTLPDKDNKLEQIFLAKDSNQNYGLIPAPKYYYKIIVDKYTRDGIVFIGVNNPHLTVEEIEKDYIFCRDVSKLVNYIEWDRKNVVAGYSFACEIDRFMKEVKHIPNLLVNKLLISSSTMRSLSPVVAVLTFLITLSLNYIR